MSAQTKAASPSDTADSSSSRFLFRLSIVSLILFGGTFVYLAIRHILYPGFTEPMEGDILHSIERVAHGLPLYPAPSGDFIPVDYLPFYYILSAPLYLIFGDSFIGPRLLSSLCALASGGVLGWIAWRESKSRTIALFAAAFYFSGYRIMDAYLTCGLPDSLLLLLLLLGFCFLAYGRARLHDALWLICFTLAFWTKQQGAIYFGFAVFYALFFRKRYEEAATASTRARHLPRWIIVLGILLGGPIAYLIVGHFLGERFFFYTLTLPGRWEHRLLFSVRRTSFILACFVPFLSLLSALYFRQAISLRKKIVNPLAWFTITSFLSAAFTMISSGSSNNHYIPFIAALSVTAALGAQTLFKIGMPQAFGRWIAMTAILCTVITAIALREYGNEHGISIVAPVTTVLVLCSYFLIKAGKIAGHKLNVALAVLLILGQFAAAIYYPPLYLPASGYQEGIARLREEIKSLDGPVIWANYGNVPAALTGMKIASTPSWVALEDIGRQQNSEKEIERDLAPFQERILRSTDLYVLSDIPVEEISGWESVAKDLALVKDFGQEFASVSQIVTHWYGSNSYPRFLYCKRERLQNTQVQKLFENSE